MTSINRMQILYCMYMIFMIFSYIFTIKAFAVQRKSDIVYIGPNPVQYLLKQRLGYNRRPRLQIEESLRQIINPNAPSIGLNREKRSGLPRGNKLARERKSHKVKRDKHRLNRKKRIIKKRQCKGKKARKPKKPGTKNITDNPDKQRNIKITVGCISIGVVLLVVLIISLLYKRNYMRIFEYCKALLGYGETSNERVATDKDREEWEKKKIILFARRKYGSHLSEEELLELVKNEGQ